MDFNSIKKRYSSTTEIPKEEYEAAKARLPEREFEAQYSKSSFSPSANAYSYLGPIDQKEFTHYYKTEFNNEQAIMLILEAMREEMHFAQKIYTLLMVEFAIAIIVGIVCFLAVILG